MNGHVAHPFRNTLNCFARYASNGAALTKCQTCSNEVGDVIGVRCECCGKLACSPDYRAGCVVNLGSKTAPEWVCLGCVERYLAEAEPEREFYFTGDHRGGRPGNATAPTSLGGVQ